jgi:hypothetical protein
LEGRGVDGRIILEWNPKEWNGTQNRLWAIVKLVLIFRLP